MKNIFNIKSIKGFKEKKVFTRKKGFKGKNMFLHIKKGFKRKKIKNLRIVLIYYKNNKINNLMTPF